MIELTKKQKNELLKVFEYEIDVLQKIHNIKSIKKTNEKASMLVKEMTVFELVGITKINVFLKLIFDLNLKS